MSPSQPHLRLVPHHANLAGQAYEGRGDALAGRGLDLTRRQRTAARIDVLNQHDADAATTRTDRSAASERRRPVPDAARDGVVDARPVSPEAGPSDGH